MTQWLHFCPQLYTTFTILLLITVLTYCYTFVDSCTDHLLHFCSQLYDTSRYTFAHNCIKLFATLLFTTVYNIHHTFVDNCTGTVTALVHNCIYKILHHTFVHNCTDHSLHFVHNCTDHLLHYFVHNCT